MKRHIIFFLIVALLLNGCSSVSKPAIMASTTIPATEQAEQTWNTEDFLEDYDQLWRDLEENYPFFPILEERGIDVNSIRMTYRSFVENTTTLEQFMDILDKVFSQMQGFAHLSLFHRDRYELLLASKPHWDSELFAPWASVLEHPRTAETYAALPRRTASANRKMAAVEYKYYPEIAAAYFHFPEMEAFAETRDQTLISDYLSKLPPIEHIIIDVTGNPGGSTLYWEKVIVAPFGGTYSGNYRVYYQDSPINQQYYSHQNLTPISQIDDTEIPSFVETLNAKFYKEEGWDVDFGESTLENGANAKRWVLIDERGYSATEQFAAFCKLTGWATLVGKQTAGDGLGGQPLLLTLTNTGLLVYFSTAMGANPDGSLNVAEGTKPDYGCLPKVHSTPLETCIDIIKAS